MNVGIVTKWCERGQAVVSRAYRDALVSRSVRKAADIKRVPAPPAPTRTLARRVMWKLCPPWKRLERV